MEKGQTGPPICVAECFLAQRLDRAQICSRNKCSSDIQLTLLCMSSAFCLPLRCHVTRPILCTNITSATHSNLFIQEHRRAHVYTQWSMLVSSVVTSSTPFGLCRRSSGRRPPNAIAGALSQFCAPSFEPNTSIAAFVTAVNLEASVISGPASDLRSKPVPSRATSPGRLAHDGKPNTWCLLNQHIMSLRILQSRESMRVPQQTAFRTSGIHKRTGIGQADRPNARAHPAGAKLYSRAGCRKAERNYRDN
jgi:hypothetical protein